MITKNFKLSITDKNVSLNKAIVLYQFDKGIQLNIQLDSKDLSIESEITQARAIILKPSGEVIATEKSDIADNIYSLVLDESWTDAEDEVGTYQIQLQLFGADPDAECVSIAPFNMEIKALIGLPPSN
jgi:hypothetical protein